MAKDISSKDVDCRGTIFPAALLILFICFYTAWFSYHSIDRWNLFQCTWGDYANIDSASFNTAYGNFMYSNARLYNYWSDHIAPILLILSGYYLIDDGYWFIFVWQSLSIGLAALPLFLIARKLLSNEWIALIIAIGYLANGKVHMGNLFDYHMAAHIGLFSLSAFYAMLNGKWGWYLLFGILLIFCKEDAAIILFMFGVYSAVAQKNFKWAAITWLISISYIMIVFSVAFPYFRSLGPGTIGEPEAYMYASNYYWLGESPIDILINFIEHPHAMLTKLLYNPTRAAKWIELMVQYGFLPLLSPLGCLILFGPSLELFLDRRYHSFSLLLHYPLMIVPLWTLASVLALSNIKKLLQRMIGYSRSKIISKAPIAVVFSFAIYLLAANIYLAKDYGALPILSNPADKYSAEQRESMRKMRKAISLIPKGVSLVATAGPYTHLHHNPNAYLFRGIDMHDYEKEKYEYVVLDSMAKRKEQRGARKAAVNSILKRKDYDLLLNVEDLYIFKRKDYSQDHSH
ncbi:MAG: DUF2079 domain-containing protein [Candidatus Nitrospinota bacterium M3_3B_026]